MCTCFYLGYSTGQALGPRHQTSPQLSTLCRSGLRIAPSFAEFINQTTHLLREFVKPFQNSLFTVPLEIIPACQFVPQLIKFYIVTQVVLSPKPKHICEKIRYFPEKEMICQGKFGDADI